MYHCLTFEVPQHTMHVVHGVGFNFTVDFGYMYLRSSGDYS